MVLRGAGTCRRDRVGHEVGPQGLAALRRERPRGAVGGAVVAARRSANASASANLWVTEWTDDARLVTPSPSSSATVSSTPQRAGDWAPGGGETCRPTIPSMPPTKPVGVELARAMRPPGLVTRTSSAAAPAWSAANMTPIAETTTSNDASGNGSSSAGASISATARCSAAARARAMPKSSGT